MRHIGNYLFIALATSITAQCVGGSISFKKNKKFASEDICSPLGSSRREIEKYKEYSRFFASSQDIDSAVKIDWDEWNSWYLLLIIVPIPTYGLWKEASPATLNFEITNRREKAITLSACEIAFISADMEKHKLKSIPKCEELAPIIVDAKATKIFHLKYISSEMNQTKKIGLPFSTLTSQEKIIQIIEIDDDWEFCTLPING